MQSDVSSRVGAFVSSASAEVLQQPLARVVLVLIHGRFRFFFLAL